MLTRFRVFLAFKNTSSLHLYRHISKEPQNMVNYGLSGKKSCREVLWE